MGIDNIIQDIKNLSFSSITADALSIFIYFIGLFLTLGLGFVFYKIKHKTKLTVIISMLIVALPLSILAGLRYGIGTDYFSYLEIMQSARRGSVYFTQVAMRFKLEKGFSFFIYFISNIFHNDGIVFFIIEYITLFFAFYAFARLHKQLNIMVAICLYYLMFYNYSLNISRQMLAMSFILLSISFLLTKKHFGYFVSVCVAYLIHSSAIIGGVFGIVYFIFKNRKIKYVTYKHINIFYMICVLVSAFFVKDIMLIIFGMFSGLEKYKRFMVGQPDVTFFSLIKGFIIVIPILLLNKRNRYDTQMIFLRNCIWLYFIIATSAYYFNYASRLIMYIRLIIILYVSISMTKIGRKQGLRLATYYIGLYALSYYHSFLINNGAETFPYMTMWNYYKK